MQEKAERNAAPPPAPPKEGSANLRNLLQPLPRRGDRTCKEISYNSLRNYALCIVHYALNKFDITDCAVAF